MGSARADVALTITVRGHPAGGWRARQTVPVLLEREVELAALSHGLGEAREGRGRVILVEAPAGLGKTSLLRAAAETAVAMGFACHRARAGELERDFAYGCVRQLLEPVVAQAPGRERDRWLTGAAALARPLFEPPIPGSPGPSTDVAFAMLHGLYWLLSNLTDDGPVALSVDDLQWADAESLRLLVYLAPRLDGLRLAVLGASRAGAADADLARLAAAPETTVLRPRPLSTSGVTALCALRLGAGVTPEFAIACWVATGGNPFFLEALLRETSAQDVVPDAREAGRVGHIGPAAVARAVLLRLAGTPAATGDLVRAVAVLGDGAGLAEAADLAGIAEDDAARAHDLLVKLEILTRGDVLEFAHPIVREAVYADIGPHERAAAHARAAGVLAARGAPAERVAAQIAETEPVGDPARVALLRRVAEDAPGRGAPAAAVAWLRRALAEPPPPALTGTILLELGSAELRIGAPEAPERLARAVDVLQDPVLLTRAVRLLGTAFTSARQPDLAVKALESAVAIVEPADRELALLIEADLAAHAQEAGREAGAPARRLERHAGLAGTTPGERLVLASLAFEHARDAESAGAAAAIIERALAGGRLVEEQELDVPPALYMLLVGLEATDALDLADSVLNRMLAEARARVPPPAVAFVLAHRGVIAFRRGAVPQAEADARTTLDLLTAHDIPLGVALALGVLVRALVEAAEGALAASSFAGDVPPGLPNNHLLESRGILRLVQGRARDAFDNLVEFGRRRDGVWGGANPLASRWRSHAALALKAIGDAG